MRIALTFALAACLVVSRANAQSQPVNAALRYWMAFAVMRDPPADKATADLLERVSEGKEAWDEAKLGPIVDNNRQVLEIMQRTSTLAFCDWGLEYDLGPNTPVAHLARARTLGRLSVVAGKRMQAQGQIPQAVDMWLAGVRFSRHIAEGGSLISALSARRVMAASLRAIHRDAVLKALDADTKKRIEQVLRAMPEDGFDWAVAMKREEVSMDVTLRRLQAAPDPKGYFARLAQMPTPPSDFTVPSASDIAAFHAFMGRVEDALSQPLSQRRARLAAAEAGRPALHQFFRRFGPSAMPLDTSGLWIEIAGRRNSLLDAITK
jgi:hypothetical protein